MTDLELIAKIAKRDREAFDSFYDRYAQIIFNLSFRILKDVGEAEDVVQEIFVQIWKEADRFDSTRASVKTWLFTIARSRSLDRYRSKKSARQRFEDQAAKEIHQIADNTDIQTTSVMRQYVGNALEKLTPEQQRVLELCYYQGLTHEEIAEFLQEPLGTIKSRIRTALIKLRTAFSGEKSDA